MQGDVLWRHVVQPGHRQAGTRLQVTDMYATCSCIADCLQPGHQRNWDTAQVTDHGVHVQRRLGLQPGHQRLECGILEQGSGQLPGTSASTLMGSRLQTSQLPSNMGTLCGNFPGDESQYCDRDPRPRRLRELAGHAHSRAPRDSTQASMTLSRVKFKISIQAAPLLHGPKMAKQLHGPQPPGWRWAARRS